MPVKDIKPGYRFFSETGLPLVTVSRAEEYPPAWHIRPFAPGKTIPQNASSVSMLSEKRILELAAINPAKTNAAGASDSKRPTGKAYEQRHTPHSSIFHQQMATARSCR